MKPERNFTAFRELIEEYNVTYKNCNIPKGSEFVYIEKLVSLVRRDRDVHKCLRYLEDRVPLVDGDQWVAFCWAYAEVLSKEKNSLFQGERCRKVKELFTFCIENHAKSLLDLHQIMVMIHHSGKLGPVWEEMVKKDVRKIGSERCTMEEIILTKANTFQPEGKILTRVDLIGLTAYGGKPVKRSIFDFYPKLVPPKKMDGYDPVKPSICDYYKKPVQKNNIAAHLDPLQLAMCHKICSPAGLAGLPALIAEMVITPKYSTAKDPSILICGMLNKMCEKVGPRYEHVVALALLWIYVGVLQRDRKLAPETAFTPVDARLGGLFKTAASQDKYENSEHIINLWNAVKGLSHMGVYPVTSAILRQTYPKLDLHLPEDLVSYKPDTFFNPIASRMLPTPAKQGKVDADLPEGVVGTPSLDLEADVIQIVGEESGNQIAEVEQIGAREDPYTPGSGPDEQPDAGSVPSPSDPDVLLFVTDPYAIIKLNPSLFPSDSGWSATSLLPPEGRRRMEKKDDDPPPSPPLPVLPTAPAGCSETLLGIDFTPEEYLEQTIADNYYAQGLKLVGGIRRVVFYHRLKFLNDIP
ncbi:uncharacterized protein LOC118435872 isoform X2 [Folsomia candida]|uniref:uncharacterized protein LOC118435872 isoform X2 n=1 Tax=Folsomia candida TaxID=158441 RepID=UPI001604F504|nr:uncharacterized protein LOC118435872 isoform X2 [Folsomia candida]